MKEELLEATHVAGEFGFNFFCSLPHTFYLFIADPKFLKRKLAQTSSF